MARTKQVEKPERPLEATPTTEKRDLHIFCTGDVFFERFIWPALEVSPSDHLPYTSPDELRTPQTTMSFREFSGAQHHTGIIKALLQAAKEKEKDDKQESRSIGTSYVEAKPDHEELLHRLDLKDDSYGPYPVFLHRLAPFSIAESVSAKNQDKVWRIKESFGHIQIATTQPPVSFPDNRRPTSIAKNWLVNELPDVLANPTIVVVNDRNLLPIAKLGEAKESISSTRSIFQNFDLPRDWHSSVNISNLLIIWLAREPLFGENNPLGEFFLNSNLAQCTIPIINHHCLRDLGITLRFDISYESSIRNFLSALTHDTIAKLLRFPQILIRFDYGILHLTTNGDQSKLLGLDIHGLNSGPYRVNSQEHGMMTGMTPLLMASIVREADAFVHCELNPDPSISAFLTKCGNYVHPTLCHSTPLDRAIDASLLLSGRHFRAGFGSYGTLQELSLEQGNGDFSGTLPVYLKLFREFLHDTKLQPYDESAFPKDIRNETASNHCHIYYKHSHSASDRLTRLSVSSDVLGATPSAKAVRSSFSRVELLNCKDLLKLSASMAEHNVEISQIDLADLTLRQIVTRGIDRVFQRNETSCGEFDAEPSVLCPFVTFGRHLSMDWQDIDSLLALRNLVEKYAGQADFVQPLPVAVFGPPGSGKSTLIREALSSISSCKFHEDLTCNLSQTESPESLARHFHRIQDRSVKGAIPIVFFDEFDSPCDRVPVGWLRYFLMPLQDGLYVEGADTFDVRRAIFVFAGGIAHHFDQFCELFLACKDQKVPDFISRLRGFANVQNISFDSASVPAPVSVRSIDASHRETGVSERSIQVRRAIFLRDVIRRRMPQIVDRNSEKVNINEKIIDAFLNVPTFTHGVRSMEAIVQMSRVTLSAQSFQPSALPQLSQLNMHVDAKLFMEIVNNT